MDKKLEQLLANLRRDLTNALYYDVDTRLAAIANYEKTVVAIRQLFKGLDPEVPAIVVP